MRHPELLIPAGSLPVLKTAVRYGADAVYIGGETMSLRAKARNFSAGEMREGIEFAHRYGKKVYVTANIFARDSDLDEAARYFGELESMEPDALLIADPGMFRLARRCAPAVPIHISTQANTTNSESAVFWHDLGASRIVTARELSISELKELRRRISPDLELGDVHFLFGPLSSEQLSGWPGRQPGSLHASLPVAVRGDGGDAPRRIYAGGGE